MIEGRSESQRGPFGMADGASEDTQSFVDFKDHGSWGDLEFSDSSLRERFFVGRRGSGKSRYLRAQERAAASKMLVFKQKTEAFRLNELKRLHREFSPDEREEIWVRLWEASINLSLGSYITANATTTRSTLPDDDWHALVDLVRQHLGTTIAPFSVIAALNHLLTATEGAPVKLRAVLDKTDWVVLEHITLKSISTMSPIAIFIDSLDENFRHAPAEGVQAQMGLLLYLARNLTDPNRTNRHHLFVTVRDVVYSQFLAHEQGEKYVNDVHWKILDWTKPAARFFFEEKIKTLDSRYLRAPGEKSNLFARWLGIPKVANRSRGVEEDVAEFLLRHTRYLPREVVELGNSICNAMSVRSNEEGVLDIWSLVVKEAEHIGQKALEVVYDHIISMASDSFASDRERTQYRASLERGFQAFRSILEMEVFPRDALDLANSAFLETVGDPDLELRLGDLLWQHGLLGYIFRSEGASNGDGIAIFYHPIGGLAGNRAFSLPAVELYRLHAALLDPSQTSLDPKVPRIDQGVRVS